MADAPFVVGIDIGSSALKVGCWTHAGNRCVPVASVAWPQDVRSDGRRVQDHCRWWDEIAGQLRHLMRILDPARCMGIGICGRGPALVLVDREMRPTGPIFADASTLSGAADLPPVVKSLIDSDDPRIRFTARCCNQLTALIENGLADPATTAHALTSWGYAASRLCGAPVGDSQICAETWREAALPQEWCAAGQGERPVVHASAAAAAETGIRQGTPIVSVGLDSFAASVGSGMVQAGDACIQAGTSTVVAAMAHTTDRAMERFRWAGCPIVSIPVRQTDDRVVARHEGVAPSLERAIRRTISVVEASAGRLRRVRVVGGWAHELASTQHRWLRADSVVEIPEEIHTGSLGCVVIAAVELGHCSSPRDAAERFCRPAAEARWRSKKASIR